MAAANLGPSDSRFSPGFPLLFELSPSLLENIIFLETPDRLLEIVCLEREKDFQHLFRTYMSQMLHGCKNEDCTTPTCLTREKRLKRDTNTPCRPPTILTARALAFYLVTTDDVRVTPCPNDLIVPISDIGFGDETGATAGEIGFQDDGQAVSADHLPSDSLSGDSLVQSVSHYMPKILQQQQHEKAYDYKSLSQNLFDTASIIFAYSKPLPSPDTVFEMLGQGTIGSTFVTSLLTIEIMEELANLVEQNPGPEGLAITRFAKRSLFYSLSRPEGWSALVSHRIDKGPQRLYIAFRKWQRLDSNLVMYSIWHCLESLFTPPPESQIKNTTRFSTHLGDDKASQVILACILALTSSIPPYLHPNWRHDPDKYSEPFSELGQDVPLALGITKLTSIKDAFQNKLVVSVVERLVQAIAARRRFSEARRRSSDPNDYHVHEPHFPLMEMITTLYPDKIDRAILIVFAEWLAQIVDMRWNGQLEVNRWGVLGGTLEILDDYYFAEMSQGTFCSSGQSPDQYDGPMDFFQIHRFKRRGTLYEMAIEFLSLVESKNTRHIFRYQIFSCSDQAVQIFRTINYMAMAKSRQTAVKIASLRNKYWGDAFPKESDAIYPSLIMAIGQGLLLPISRGKAIQGALNALWGLQKADLMKPLKVTFQGEEGVDQGGLLVEFFQLVTQELMNPEGTFNGMFKVLEPAKLLWFQVASPEPLWKFEMLGAIFSLALYNNVTLPVNFPLVFYAKLLGRKIDDFVALRDGWEDLHHTFKALLTSEDPHVFDLDYEISFEIFDLHLEVDLRTEHRWRFPWPSNYNEMVDCANNPPWPPGMTFYTDRGTLWNRPEGGPDPLSNKVTMDNRRKYVSDYVFHLMDQSIRPQFLAFKNGFYKFLEEKSLQLFNERKLRQVIEGDATIEVNDLRRITDYEGFPGDEAHNTISQFWSIVEGFSHKQRKRLVEFITAVGRLPATHNMSRHMQPPYLCIQRDTNDDMRLPTARTCSRTLLLPQYSSAEIMEEKLCKALDHTLGFYLA